MRFYPCLLGLCQSDLSRMLFAPVSTARLFSLTVARTANTAQGPIGSKWSSCPRLLQNLFCVCCFWVSEIRIREQGGFIWEMVPDNSGGRGSGSADEGGAGGLFPRVGQQAIAVGAGSLVPLGNAGSQGPWPASGTFLPKAAGAGASFLHLLSVTGCGLPPAPAVTLGCEEGGRDPGEVCWIEGPQAASFPRARTVSNEGWNTPAYANASCFFRCALSLSPAVSERAFGTCLQVFYLRILSVSYLSPQVRSLGGRGSLLSHHISGREGYRARSSSWSYFERHVT